jgi:hypothetical protein
MEPKKSAFSTALKYAIITALASLIFTILIYMIKIHVYWWAGVLGLLIPIAGLIFLVKERRDKDLNGYITFGQAFSIGFLFFVLIGAIGMLTGFLMNEVIAPDMSEDILRNMEDKLLNRGMSEEQVEMTMRFQRKLQSSPLREILTLIGSAIIGALFSLIVAAIFKKEDRQLQQPQ